jgi:hypothetical protein
MYAGSAGSDGFETTPDIHSDRRACPRKERMILLCRSDKNHLGRPTQPMWACPHSSPALKDVKYVGAHCEISSVA